MSNLPRPQRADTYRVPQRFSIAEILAMTTVFGLLFGGLRSFGASPVLYMYLGTQAVMICLVQMWFGSVPRGASTLVGGVFLPVWLWGLMALGNHGLPAKFEGSWDDLPFAVLFGGLLGYCTGAMVAGVFLVMDRVDGLALRAASRRRARLPQCSVESGSLPGRQLPTHVMGRNFTPTTCTTTEAQRAPRETV